MTPIVLPIKFLVSRRWTVRQLRTPSYVGFLNSFVELQKKTNGFLRNDFSIRDLFTLKLTRDTALGGEMLSNFKFDDLKKKFYLI